MSSYSPERYPSGPQPASRSILAPLLILLAGVLLLWWYWPRSHSGIDPNAAPRPVTARGDLGEDEKATIELFRHASPSVVHITTARLQRDFFSFDVAQIPQGTGSGFIWDQDGHIVTNFHVIQNASSAQITLADHSSFDAELVGAYADKDLAVLLIHAPQGKLQRIPLGSSHDLQVGQKTFAIGNPFGLDQTLTTGIVSALGREIESVTRRPIKNVIQTDAAINPGNSGGPLLDSSGRLIGVNTAIYSPSGVSAGIGFAIPVDEVNRFVPELIRHGKLVHGDLAVQISEDQVARRVGVKGALILRVRQGSAAERAGLRPTRRNRLGHIQLGDVIVALDGKPIQSKEDWEAAVEQHRVGDTVTLTILRNDERQDVQVTLETEEG
jgi:S1-C subfamily serine protease